MLLSFAVDAPAPEVMEAASQAVAPSEVMNALATIGGSTVYLMGFSFILGSLFTILILILLDFMRRNAQARP